MHNQTEGERHKTRFFNWIIERHRIWRRRFLDLKPPPWSKDPLLVNYKFTNSYRELDRGTLWYLEHLALPLVEQRQELGQVKFTAEFIWQSCVYRLLNRIETFEAVGGAVPTFATYGVARDRFEGALRRIQAAGKPVFTSAHLTCPCPKGVDKIGGYMLALDSLYETLPRTVGLMFNVAKTRPWTAEGAKRIHKLLQSSKCMGHFTAYEVYCDMGYFHVLPFDEDTWANAGPGAQKGLKLIYGEQFNDWLTGMIKLRDEFRNYWGKKMGALADPKFEPYTGITASGVNLRLIEHCLCEYGKYDRLSQGTGKTRMVFNALAPGHLPSKGHAKYVEELHARVRDSRLVWSTARHR